MRDIGIAIESVLCRVRIASLGPMERVEHLLLVGIARRALVAALRAAEPSDPLVTTVTSSGREGGEEAATPTTDR